MVPSIEMVRFVSSGTEATMSAVRLARAATGRDADREDRRRLPRPRRRVPRLGRLGRRDARDRRKSRRPGRGRRADASSSRTTTPHALEAAFRRYPGEIAAFIVEPVAANMGVVPPRPGYLEAVARDHDAPRRAPHLRRGHLRVSAWRRAARRSSTASAGPDDPRQDPRRRPARSARTAGGAT